MNRKTTREKVKELLTYSSRVPLNLYHWFPYWPGRYLSLCSSRRPWWYSSLADSRHFSCWLHSTESTQFLAKLSSQEVEIPRERIMSLIRLWWDTFWRPTKYRKWPFKERRNDSRLLRVPLLCFCTLTLIIGSQGVPYNYYLLCPTFIGLLLGAVVQWNRKYTGIILFTDICEDHYQEMAAKERENFY